MPLTLIDAHCPDDRFVDVAFRHEDPELPAAHQADNQPLVATLPLDLHLGEAKSPARAHLNLSSGELHLIHDGTPSQVEASRSADEIRLTLYIQVLGAVQGLLAQYNAV